MTADVIVVGCGVQGLSVAENLRRRGQTVLVIDRVGPGRQTSSLAAGQSVIAQTDPAMGSLMHRSIGDIIEFEARTGVPLVYHQAGSIKYALQDWSAEQLQREVQRATKLGARVGMIDLAEAGRLAPHTDSSAATAAWYAPDDIYFEAADLASSMYEAATRAGVEFRFGVDVTNLEVSSGRVTGVRTTDGIESAASVVIAAGAWTSELLGRSVGLDLPLIHVRHQYSIRQKISGIRFGLPSVRVVDDAIYARPVGKDLMFGTYEPQPMEFSVKSLPDRTADTPLDGRAIELALGKISGLFPGVADSTVRTMRGGMVTMTPDGSYIIDELETASGAYFMTGCNVMGLSVSPALGADMAEWLTTGQRPSSISGFALDRFGPGMLSSEDVRRQSLSEYESIYRDAGSNSQVRVTS
ncbi:NAD(P)/FAD-dependent oxidoreductase [Brevibacterium zhoupengii]|uniref:NAD(P)/FAD-dependent oxidoreductase n=1 Tax=Brevibacterium zhoupengii TaxID=2898795 RepID=UPI001E42F485|nr:FAD-binding oxidoreductase [Brevibacterium zhoupengii]